MDTMLLLRPMRHGGPTVPWYLAGGVAAANCVAAYQPLGAVDLADSYLNLISPGTYDAVAKAGLDPAFDPAVGWISDGTKWLKCPVQVANDQTWSMVIRYSDVASAGVLCGTTAGGGYPYFLIWPQETLISYANGGDANKSVAVPASGVLAVAGVKGYRNGVDESVTCSAQAGTFPVMVAIMACALAANDEFAKLACSVQAFALYNATLTAAQVLAISTRMAALP